MIYKGSCHCGNVAYQVEGDIGAVVTCNCSICVRKAALLWAVPRDKLQLMTSEEELRSYAFNNHVIVHRFCRTCGMHPYAEHLTADDGPTAYVNVRCLEAVDLSKLEVIQFDGASV